MGARPPSRRASSSSIVRELYRLGVAGTCAVALAACAHYPHTAPLSSAQAPEQRYTFESLDPGPENTDSLFICAAFSGGGTRAAALAFGVLAKLKATPISWEGQAKSVLSELDCISSVSGGSFTAAYYGLFGDELFTHFRSDFLERDVEGAIAERVLALHNLARLASPTFSRIDVAAELYSDLLFGSRTYGELLRLRRRPFLILNATDLQTADRFEFTQDQFDLIGDDLSQFPVSRAVAASSAFPFLLAPLTLESHPRPPGVQPSAALVAMAQSAPEDNRLGTYAAHALGYLDVREKPYVHLMDGGLTDNIGLRALWFAYQRSDGFLSNFRAGVKPSGAKGPIKTLVLISVNAKNGEPDHYGESPPGLVEVAYKTATVGMDNYNYETIELWKDARRERLQAQSDVKACNAALEKGCPGAAQRAEFPSDVQVFVVDIGLDQVKDDAKRKRLQAIPTNFVLSKIQVQDLIETADELVEQHPEWKRFLQSLGAGGTP
jgi:NTE family protein